MTVNDLLKEIDPSEKLMLWVEVINTPVVLKLFPISKAMLEISAPARCELSDFYWEDGYVNIVYKGYVNQKV